MRNIIFKIPEGTYSSPAAIHNVIGYIASGSFLPVGGYGFWPPLPDTIMEQFEDLQNFFNPDPKRYIWHFIISFDALIDQRQILITADSICKLFHQHYQIVFGIHQKRDFQKTASYHIHFAVNPVSHQLTGLELTENVMKHYISQITVLLTNTFGLQVQMEGVRLC